MPSWQATTDKATPTDPLTPVVEVEDTGAADDVGVVEAGPINEDPATGQQEADGGQSSPVSPHSARRLQPVHPRHSLHNGHWPRR